MARLNEVAVPSESIESLKRKFMRQNRDIARANSTQSLRIRSLENETSRLLAENLGLREQILQLQNEVENGRTQKVVDHAKEIKSQLQDKLLEIGALIDGFGEVPPLKKRPPQRGKATKASPNTSPDQRNWKGMCTLGEAVTSQEGRLPPIIEDKIYPRRTLERQEVGNIIEDTDHGVDISDSPEIGPPPVSQFVDEDPFKLDLPKRAPKSDQGDSSRIDPALSINLEQRKKRKDSVGSSAAKSANSIQTAQEIQEDTHSLKAGAKRKLSVREDEEPGHFSRTVEQSPDEFKFTRVLSDNRIKNKAPSESNNSGPRPARELAVARGVSREKRSSTTTTTSRVALAPKSVNASPRKNSKAVVQDPIKAAKTDIPKFNPTKDHTQDKRRESVADDSQCLPVMDTIECLPEPETPAGLDIFSPSSSQPSTTRVESRDTPPPPDLAVEGQRPSRRARNAVSYAEPSLRDKMRRPTKELVDAVTGEGKSNRGSFAKLEEGKTSTGINIKAETEDEDAWKRMPLASAAAMENSPLRSKAPDQNILPSSITTHRKRRESLLHQDSEDRSKTGSGTAISALISEHRKAKAAAKVQACKKEKAFENRGEELTKAMAELDIYEFNETSPRTEAKTIKASMGDKPASRPARRHSSVPRDLTVAEDGEASDIEATKKREAPSTRRRQSTMGLKIASGDTDVGPERTIRKTNSSSGLPDPGTGESRGDRIAARRRSMML